MLLELVVRAIVDDIRTKARHSELVGLTTTRTSNQMQVHQIHQKKESKQSNQYIKVNETKGYLGSVEDLLGGVVEGLLSLIANHEHAVAIEESERADLTNLTIRKSHNSIRERNHESIK